MDETDLKNLKDIETPLPRPQARDAAMRAAMQAFEQSSEIAEENKSTNTQGSRSLPRLISTAFEQTMEWIMKQRTIIAAAAVAAIAVPVTIQVFDGPSETRAPTGALLDIASNQPRDDAKTETPVQKRSRIAQESRKFAERADGKLSIQDGGEQKGDLFRKTKKNEDKAGSIQFARKPAPVSERSSQGTLADGRSQIQPTTRIATLPPKIEQPKPQRPATSRSVRRKLASGIYVDDVVTAEEKVDRDQFADFETSPIKQVGKEPVSTFSIDVDTASYTFARKLIQQGRLPQKHAVRTEEMVNYFKYNYPAPETAETPFRSTVAVYPTPWNENTKLIHIGIKGYDIASGTKPRANLVFLLDVSGSMSAPDKLPLLKSAFRLLVDKLDAEDTVSIVTYAGRAGTVLEPTKASDKAKILAALDNLRSGGSTAGAQGIRQAYALAEQNKLAEGVNRVILATDGDFNVGITDRAQLKTYIAEKRKSGVFLSVLGFGTGNYNDALMQTLAQNGNGNAAYIDNLNEARKVLVEEAGSTLFPIAKDVKIQIEFNPALVSEYRLIGYETRALRNEDFNNDKIDAGDIGSGHTVTAIYEITPVGAKRQGTDELRYQSAAKRTAQPVTTGTNPNEYAFLKLRYKLPKEDTSKLVSLPVTRDLETGSIADASQDVRFAASVAAFAEKLRGNPTIGNFSWDQIAELAAGARGNDRFGYRNEFVSLVRLAKALRR